MRRGWWRRNLWGLLLVLPVTAGLFAFNADLIYYNNFTAQPKRPAPVNASGTAVLDDIEVTLDSIEAVDADDPALTGRDITLPASVRPWRAAVTISVADEDAYSLCTVALIDTAGRRYPSSPPALPLGTYGCAPDDLDATSPYTATFYFLLPAQSRPRVLEISWPQLLPRYVRLPASA